MATSSKHTQLIHSHRKLQHLLLSAALEEAGAPKIIIHCILVTMVLVLSILGWATFTKVPEVASAPGEVVPRGQIPLVQHLEGGIVAKVLVEDGQFVEEGTPILLLSPTVTLSELKKLRNKETAVHIDLLRVEAFINDTPLSMESLSQRVPKPEQMSEEDYYKLTDNALSLLKQQRIASQREKSMLKQQITKLENDINNLKRQGDHINLRKSNLQKQVDMFQKASKTKASSQINLLQAKDRLSEVVTDFLEVEASIASDESALNEAKDRFSNLEASLLQDAFSQRSKMNQQLLEIRDSLMAAKEKAQRLTVFAPVKGTVKGLKLDTGSVVPPGGVIFELVPQDETLVVEARVKPEDIGHIKLGDDVRVKVSAFNFSRYGQIPGTIEQISASTFLDELGHPYYKVVVKLEKSYVGEIDSLNRILPGMTVTADITTGSKSLISYMIKPVQTTLSESFRER